MMGVVETCAIGLALAMDCFTVSIATGITAKKCCYRRMAAMTVLFGVFQGGMAWLGWYVGSLFHHLIESVDHWIAFGLLAYLGVRMIRNGMKEETQDTRPLNYPVIFTMAVATSIDALAVGVSMSFLQQDTWQDIIMPCSIFALFSSLLTLAGLGIGIFASRRIPFRAELLGGIILIAIGCKILLNHLY